uniref:Uncharacterized protein n=1 Tax=Zea mays TaxID=4577 RepID=C4J5J2_MAIZE|nr:unknown [Zea mays]|eukprot:NP_001183331.1 uncharacterized protein LOC100501734 [Zea mays]
MVSRACASWAPSTTVPPSSPPMGDLLPHNVMSLLCYSYVHAPILFGGASIEGILFFFLLSCPSIVVWSYKREKEHFYTLILQMYLCLSIFKIRWTNCTFVVSSSVSDLEACYLESDLRVCWL